MIDLTSFNCRTPTPTLLTAATLHKPVFGGGAVQKVDRLGDRFAIDFETPVMEMESEGRRAIARLQRAQREGGRVEYPQPDFLTGAVGNPVVNLAHTGGMTLNIKSATPHYAVQEGQALNLVVASRYYLYFAAANAILDAAGAGAILLTTPMRTHLAGNEPVELAKPVIEGWLDGNERSWTIDVARTTGLKFTITERS